MTGILALTFSALVLATPLQAQSNKRSTPAERTAAYFESLRKTPPQLFAFLKLMPKVEICTTILLVPFMLSRSFNGRRTVVYAFTKPLSYCRNLPVLATPARCLSVTP